jgi:hypothetical protein
MRGHSKEGREPVKVRRRKTLTLKRRLTTHPDNALQTLHEIQYRKWREFDPDDTVRFYSLRLREAGVIRSSPNNGTDWRFFNDLKGELKGLTMRRPLVLALLISAPWEAHRASASRTSSGYAE